MHQFAPGNKTFSRNHDMLHIMDHYVHENIALLNLTHVEHNSIYTSVELLLSAFRAYCRHCCPASQALINLDSQFVLLLFSCSLHV